VRSGFVFIVGVVAHHGQNSVIQPVKTVPPRDVNRGSRRALFLALTTVGRMLWSKRVAFDPIQKASA